MSNTRNANHIISAVQSRLLTGCTTDSTPSQRTSSSKGVRGSSIERMGSRGGRTGGAMSFPSTRHEE